MYRGGYWGKLLRVNLTDRLVAEEVLPFRTARNFLGGAGFGVKYLYDEVPPGADPLGPDNKLILAPGPFTGTSVPCASRLAIAAKSPLTGAVGVALTGGSFPAELKFAGYDLVILEGRADKPTYLWIKDGQVQLRDAQGLWGTHTSDCQQLLKDELRDQAARIACIGPAGETLSCIAAIINERRAAGRKGLGAVMGAKNLKAIAVRGTGAVPVADEEKLRLARGQMRQLMKDSPVLYPTFAKIGTPMVTDVTAGLGIFPARNWLSTGEFDPVPTLGVEAQQRQNVGRNPCYGCPVGCSQIKKVRGGAYRGLVSEGPEYESVYSLGGQTGVHDLDAIITADRLCDELGLDSISAGVAVGYAMELTEKGLLSEEQTGGLNLRFGDAGAMLSLLRSIALREGLGELLADGVRAAAERIGGEALRYAMHVKGLELPGYDVRGAKAHGLNYATAYTGADHNRGYAFQEIFGIPVPGEVDRFAAEGKGELCKWNQDMRTATCDCPTMCSFLLDTSLPATAAENTAALMEAVTGLTYTPEQIVEVGERVNNLARAFNVREGFTRADDTLPARLLEEPLKQGASKGQLVARAELELMLDEYYAARGWDQETGVPTRERLEALELTEAADDLQLPVRSVA